MIRIQACGLGGLGQTPVPSPGREVKMSSVVVQTPDECAKRNGQLFDSSRLCCVKMNPVTGNPDPNRTSDYSWYCAQTAFGAPVTAPPGAAPYLPPLPPSYASMTSPATIALIGGGALLLIITLLRR